MRLSEPRLEPLPESEWNEEVRATLKNALRVDGRPANIFATLAHHPKLLKRWLVFGNHVLAKSTLGAREREIVILRVGWLCRSEYEWGQHVPIGKKAGLDDDEIERITRGPDAPGWGELDRLLLCATDELVGDARISDDTWSALQAHYDEHQLIDLVFAVGQYNLVSMALNSLGVQPESEDVPRLPER